MTVDAGEPAVESPAEPNGEPIILAIDSAGAACSVAVAAGERVLVAHRRAMMHGHGEALLPMIDQTIREAGLGADRLDLVVTTIGPGGFTGIRVGLAAARGIALASGAELFGVSGFDAVAAAVMPNEEPGLLLIALESRRTDLYVQLFDRQCRPLTAAMTVAPEALGETVAGAVGAAPLRLAGDAAARAAAALDHPSLQLLQGTAPDAVGVARAARRRWRPGQSAEPIRPLYLRPPGVTLPAGASRPQLGPERTADGISRDEPS